MDFYFGRSRSPTYGAEHHNICNLRNQYAGGAAHRNISNFLYIPVRHTSCLVN